MLWDNFYKQTPYRIQNPDNRLDLLLNLCFTLFFMTTTKYSLSRVSRKKLKLNILNKNK